jgi:HSP20 family molecular chaperone IbpA
MAEQAKATFRDGVLEITMPAPPSAKGRRLEITEAAKK